MCPCAQVGGLRPAAAVGPGLSFLTGQRSLPTHSVKTTRSSTLGSHLFAVREQSAMSPVCQPSRWHKGPYLGTLTCKARLPKNSKSLAKGCSFVLSGLWSRNNVENIATLCNDKVRSSQSTEFLQPVEVAQPNF